CYLVFFFQAEDGIRDFHVTGVQTCALPISSSFRWRPRPGSRWASCTRGCFGLGAPSLRGCWPGCRKCTSCGWCGPTGRCPWSRPCGCCCPAASAATRPGRSEEHTSELQSREKLVCRLLLEKKKSNADLG